MTRRVPDTTITSSLLRTTLFMHSANMADTRIRTPERLNIQTYTRATRTRMLR
jgi:hypothetical protein